MIWCESGDRGLVGPLSVEPPPAVFLLPFSVYFVFFMVIAIFFVVCLILCTITMNFSRIMLIPPFEFAAAPFSFVLFNVCETTASFGV